MLIQRACQKLDIPCIPSRMAMLTKPLNGRAACHYCGQCGRGCQTASAFTSSQAMIFPAMKTGKLKIITGAMARELITDGDGKVTAVSYVDKATRTEKQIRCRAVVVAASACESARLLLNSKSSRFPNGLANGSGMVGRNLTDTTGYDLSGHVPALDGLPRHNSRRHRRHARLRAVVAARRQEEGFPARLSHRDRRRIRHAADRQLPRRAG